jgi:integral membrane protein
LVAFFSLIFDQIFVMIRLFKFTALFEGLSLLLLLFVAMPLKYLLGMPEMVRTVGMAHGVLFIAYIIFAVMLKPELRWGWKTFTIVCLASVVPLGTFYVEKKYLP